MDTCTYQYTEPDPTPPLVVVDAGSIGNWDMGLGHCDQDESGAQEEYRSFAVPVTHDWRESLFELIEYVEESPTDSIIDWVARSTETRSDCAAMEWQSATAAYRLSDPDEVRRFLDANPGLLAVVREATSVIKEHFDDPRLTLRLFSDPEEPDLAQLVIWIGSRLTPSEAMKQRKALMRAWGFDATRLCGNRLSVSIEPI